MSNTSILPPVFTIDCPSGSCKGTIVKLVAHRLGWHMLDSGALYRLVAYGSQNNQLSFENEAVIADYAANLDVEFKLVDAVPALKRVKMDKSYKLSLREKWSGLNFGLKPPEMLLQKWQQCQKCVKHFYSGNAIFAKIPV